ncbi:MULTISPECIES: type II toxin-antitoxin system HipA family toxin [Hydrogenophaga]|uniref:HipA-like protein n=1 Tax=Hydrogenophaga intermedia TaxID=65786 RepID=A0A1L1PP22_HYDIT|nr:MULTISPECIES: type II toxin-antitoxin system HipA family toxin [Hydrogenophaga]TMU70130.1 type II toxin-antitoxin system HipA family toxin [Hydrogenophaga intermedia]CDN90524.1 HipA-like protein [Hydrogenophaga intermedia]
MATTKPKSKPTRKSPYSPVRAVEVRAWGKLVGAVALEPTKNYYAFSYDPSWVKRGIELAPLRMPLEQASEPFLFTDLPEATYKRLPAMLADALPDDFGNALIDAWMAERGLSKGMVSALDRLAYMGKRGMGALTFGPLRGPPASKPTVIEMGKLVESARKAVQGDFDGDDHAITALKQIIQVGTSAGGARAKATIAWNPITDEVRTGQFDIPDGFEAWLLKFDGMGVDNELGPSKSYGRIEYAYYLMADAANIDMSPCRLLRENGRAHFMTKRFDREGNERLHMQTLCAMAHLDYKLVGTHSYNQLLQTAQALKLDRKAMVQLLRRMIFNVLAVNNDDHTKNFSFLLRQGEQWELAPAYDITHAYRVDSDWVSQHQMSINGKFDRITLADVRVVADRFGLLADLAAAVEDVRRAVSRWVEFADEAQVDPIERDEIERQMGERDRVF